MLDSDAPLRRLRRDLGRWCSLDLDDLRCSADDASGGQPLVNGRVVAIRATGGVNGDAPIGIA